MMPWMDRNVRKCASSQVYLEGAEAEEGRAEPRHHCAPVLSMCKQSINQSNKHVSCPVLKQAVRRAKSWRRTAR